jgi:hypothetical protein
VFTARYELNLYTNSDYLRIKWFSDSQILLLVTLNLEQVKDEYSLPALMRIFQLLYTEWNRINITKLKACFSHVPQEMKFMKT